MIDYKIEIGQPKDIQRKLNQWKHKYFVHIEDVCIVDNTNVSSPLIMMVISREEK